MISFMYFISFIYGEAQDTIGFQLIRPTFIKPKHKSRDSIYHVLFIIELLSLEMFLLFFTTLKLLTCQNVLFEFTTAMVIYNLTKPIYSHLFIFKNFVSDISSLKMCRLGTLVL